MQLMMKVQNYIAYIQLGKTAISKNSRFLIDSIDCCRPASDPAFHLSGSGCTLESI